MATASATASAPAYYHPQAERPNLVSVGTIVWLSSELMFFAALFAMYFTIRNVQGQEIWDAANSKLNVPFSLANTIVLVLSSITCQIGVFRAERGLVGKMRFWFSVTFVMGAVFVAGQVFEYSELIRDGLTIASEPFGSVFYLTTGFHAAHVTGGLLAFLLVLGRTFAAKRFTHEQATSAIVVSYYWHFVDVVWIGLYSTIYIIK